MQTEESETIIFKLKRTIHLTSKVTFSDLFQKVFWTLEKCHISVGELTLDVGVSTSHVGEVVVGELACKRPSPSSWLCLTTFLMLFVSY